MNEQDAYKKLIQTEYRAYCYYVHRGDWKPTPYHSFLCKTVQDFIERETGNPYDILILSCPPQTGKSLTVTETLPSYYLMRNPKDTVIELSYSGDLAKRFGRRNKEKIIEHGHIFGCGLSAESKSASEWELDNKIGRMISNGIDGQATGNKANLLVIDDPIKSSSDADSKTKRDKLWDLWFSTFRSRVWKGGKVILIMTRWHEDDLAGRLAKDEFATVLNIPCEAEENDPLGREVGDAICPEIGKGNEWLIPFKRGMLEGHADENGEAGIRAWNALYQGHPTNAEGNIIKREWWQRYDFAPTFDKLIMSVDCAFKGTSDADRVAIEVWGKKDNNFYLVDLIEENLSFPDTVLTIRAVASQHRLSEILIEDKANGAAVISILRMELSGIIAVNPLGGKESRVNAISFLIEAGNVYLPRKGWVNGFIDECASFPKGRYDDAVDSMSQALYRLYFVSNKDIKAPTKQYLFPIRERKTHFERGSKSHVV